MGVVAGNVSSETVMGSINVDQTNPPAPTLALAADTGSSNSDGITSNGQVNVTGLEAIILQTLIGIPHLDSSPSFLDARGNWVLGLANESHQITKARVLEATEDGVWYVAGI